MDPSSVTVAIAAAVVIAQLPGFKPVTEATSSAASLNHFIDFHFTRQLIVVAAVGLAAPLRPLTESSSLVVGHPPQQHRFIATHFVCSEAQAVITSD